MLDRVRQLALGLLLALAAGRAEAEMFTYRVIDPNGPPVAWGKGVGDLDGDGRTDLLIGSKSTGLFWYRNPDWSKRTISSTASIEEDMQIVDLNADGRRDVVAITKLGATWFENTGTDWIAHPIESGTGLHDIAVADLDRDGKLDLIGRNQGSSGNKLFLWRQDTLTTWVKTTIVLPQGGEGLLVTDLDRDGKKDIATDKYWFKNNSGPGAISLVRYTFRPPDTANPANPAAVNAYVTLGDMNGDGRVDLVTSPAEPAGGSYKLAWFEAPAEPTTGTWDEHVIEDGVPSVTHFVGVADFDGDGALDVATALTQKAANPKIKIYYNTSRSGDFGSPNILADTSSHSMKIVDIDNDGNKSLFGADYDNRTNTPIKLWQAGSPPRESTYVGCFKDQGGGNSVAGRDLDGYLLVNAATLTVDSCVKTCGDRGFAAAGLQAGRQCFCGDSFGRFGPATACTIPCPGNAAQTCGGTRMNSVYRLP